jgi:glutathione peroxidase
MVDLPRRRVLTAGAALMTTAAPADTIAWGFSFASIEEGTLALEKYRGRVLLVTNTASFCGYTYQYEQLEKLHAALTPNGLTVIGVPSQDFNQESGSNAVVKQFCETTFGIDFPMAGLSHVRGPQAHPFYQWVKTETQWEPQWNFYKVLIGRDGRIGGLFGSGDEPAGAKLRGAVDAALSVGA